MVASALAALLVVGALAPRASRAGGRVGPGTLLGRVNVATRTAAVWNCPGPLPVGSALSSIAISNVGSTPATATVLVAETELPPSRPGTAVKRLPTAVRRISVPARSEEELAVDPTGNPGRAAPGSSKATASKTKTARGTLLYASVSVQTAGTGVAVAEEVKFPGNPVSSPCAAGDSEEGYLASGVTAGSSSDEVAVFNPSATPAVAKVAVGTEAGYVRPPALQALVVKPRSMSLVDLGRYVPLRPHLAVAVRATVGRVVVGSLGDLSRKVATSLLGPLHAYPETGQQLCVGLGSAATSWLVQGVTAGGAQAVRIFNPGSRTAEVELSTPPTRPGLKPATLSLGVAPGVTETAFAPGEKVTSGHAATGAQPALLSVKSTNGTGVVVEGEDYVSVSHGRRQAVELLSSPPSLATARVWIVPAAEHTAYGYDQLLVTNTASRAVTFSVQRLAPAEPGGQAGAPADLANGQVPPGSSTWVDLHGLVAASAAPFGLELKASGPVLLSGRLVISAKAGAPGVVAVLPGD